MEVIYSIHAKLGGAGTGTIACHAVKGLERQGHLKKVICTSHNNCIDPNKVFMASKILNHAPAIVIRNEAFDLLAGRYIDECDIFHGWNGSCLRQLRKAKGLGGVTIVERASSYPPTQYRLLSGEYKKYGINKKPTNELLLRKGLKELEECDYVTIPSRFVYNSFIEHGFNEEKLIQIPFGVDINRFKPVDFEKDVFRVIVVGQISLRKGVQYLLKAWHELNLKNAELVLIGRILDAKKIVDEFRRKTSFKIIKWVDDLNDLNEMYNRSSLFVLPSIEEGSALVTYEAMACGLPQVVTENCGSIAIDGKHGFILPIRDVKALKEKIQYFYDNESEMNRMGKEARKYVEGYTWEKYGERLVKVYEERT